LIGIILTSGAGETYVWWRFDHRVGAPPFVPLSLLEVIGDGDKQPGIV